MHFAKFRQCFRAVVYPLFVLVCAALGQSLASGQSTAPWFTTATASNGVATWYVPNPNNVGIGTSILPSAPVNYTEFAIQGAWGTKVDMGGNGSLEVTILTDAAGMLLTTVNTSFPLRVGVAGNENMRVDVTGNVGIGTTAPGYNVQITANNPGNGILSMLNNTASNGLGAQQAFALANTGNWAIGMPSASPDFAFWSRRDGHTAGTERIRFTSGGNVGIGLQNPIYPLSVKGTIGAGEVVVTNTSGWSDYVFAPGYRLTPLSEVAEYVKANGHLPEVPSAAEVAEKGVSLGDMQVKLLAKIEELTLHMIAAENENRELRETVRKLGERVARTEQGSGRAAFK